MPIRASKDVVLIPVEFDREIAARLDAFCAKSGRSRKAVIQAAVLEHAEQPVRPLPALLEEIALRKRGGLITLATPSGGAKPKRKEKRTRSGIEKQAEDRKHRPGRS